MAILSDEKVSSLTRRLVDTVIDYKKEAERLAIENETLRAALREIAKVTYGWEPGVWSDEEARNYFASLFFGAQSKARAALGGKDE